MEKKNTGLFVTIIILSLIVVGLGGLVVYDKTLSKNDKIEEKNTNNIKETEEKNNKSTKTENEYQIFSDKLKNNINTKYDDYNSNYEYVINNFIEDGYSIQLKSSGDLYIQYTSDELNKKYGNYKIDDNVLSFYIIKTGQSDANMLYYIKTDGTVSSANTEYSIRNNEDIEIKNNIGNYKNIVSIVSGTFGDRYSGVRGPIFIDINGNIHSENLK